MPRDEIANEALKELQDTLMEGTQSSTSINMADLLFRQLHMINVFAGLHDERFIYAVDNLEDALADSLDEEYKQTVEDIYKKAKEEESKKTNFERDPIKKANISNLFFWNRSRLKYRALQKLLQRSGYKPRRDVVQVDSIDPGQIESDDETADDTDIGQDSGEGNTESGSVPAEEDDEGSASRPG